VEEVALLDRDNRGLAAIVDLQLDVVRLRGVVRVDGLEGGPPSSRMWRRNLIRSLPVGTSLRRLMTLPFGSRMVDCFVPVIVCPDSSKSRCWIKKEVPSMIATRTEISVPSGVSVVVAVTTPARKTAFTPAVHVMSLSPAIGLHVVSGARASSGIAITALFEGMYLAGSCWM
jgi:hypothetical protein